MRLWISIPNKSGELDKLKATGVTIINGPATRGDEIEAEIEVNDDSMRKLDPYFGNWIWGPM